MFAGFLLGVFLTWFIYWLIHKGKVNELNATVASLKGEQDILERQKSELENKLKEAKEQMQIVSLSEHQNLPLSGFFVIECRHVTVGWKLRGVPGRPRPLLPRMPLPDDATLVLSVNAEVTAAPSLLVQNLELEVMGMRLSEEDWKSQEVRSGVWWFYFAIPTAIPSGKHHARIVATIPKNSSEIEERKFPPFEILIEAKEE